MNLHPGELAQWDGLWARRFVNRAFDTRGGFFDVVEGGGQGRRVPQSRGINSERVWFSKLPHPAPCRATSQIGIQHVAHFARELVGIEGLGEKTHAGFAPVMGMERFLR